MTEMKHDKFARMKCKNGESLFVNTEYITAYGFIKEQDKTVITVLGEGKEIYFPGDQTNKLLKEQQPVKPEIEGSSNTWWYVCGDCHEALDVNDKYCRHCGRSVKWE